MIYKGIFDLQGTALQQQIAKEALDMIHFPWKQLTPPRGTFIIGWQNLNDGRFMKAAEVGPKLHAGHHEETKEEKPETLEGHIEGRRYIMGIFYPNSGHTYVDINLAYSPMAARQTVSAELGHLVDYFLPLTDQQKYQLHTLMHSGERPQSQEHLNEWWEKYDYGTEYYGLAGEAFMQAFTFGYSDMDFDASDFDHQITKEEGKYVRAILGFERTDYVPPVVVAPVEPAPAPTPPPAPAPAPVLPEYKTLKGTKTYHKTSHYPAKAGILTTNTTGLTACKVCKP